MGGVNRKMTAVSQFPTSLSTHVLNMMMMTDTKDLLRRDVLPYKTGNHSNAVVGLNKTKTRNSLALDGTLSSIMTIKMADLEPCFKWEPPSDVLKASKKATGQYNRAHRS
ncbi:unnamed protein product [Boreogadus saida]